MLKASMLVEVFLDQPEWMMCIRTTLASIVDLNFSLPSWLRWMKLLATTWNWILSPITFSINLPRVLSKTIGLNNLGKLYNDLLGLRMIIVDDLLKWFGQYSKSIQVFVIFMMLVRQILCFRIDLRWLYDNLSSPGVDKLLQLLITILNSSFENGAQAVACLFPILSRILLSTCQWRAVLNEE